MRLYLDPSVLVKLFKSEPGSDTMVEMITAIDEGKGWAGFTSQWSALEVARALKKDGKPRELILLDLRELRRHRISFTQIRSDVLKVAEDVIVEHEIYASDALHAATFKSLEKPERLDAFLCDDAHFLKLGSILKTVTLDEVKFP